MKAPAGYGGGKQGVEFNSGPDDAGGLGSSLLVALRNTGVSVSYQDAELRMLWSHNLPPGEPGRKPGISEQDLLPADEAARVVAEKRLALADGLARRLEIKIAQKGRERWFDFWIDPDLDEAGRARGIVSTVVEITDRKRREQTLRALLREVSHRSKNLLAIIQGVATQTGRHSDSIERFLHRFRGRIQSLASSQDLVTSSNWRGATLRELMLGQVSRYCDDPSRSFAFEGENPHLNPNAALHIGLALHELTVNSVSYGALSRPQGRIFLVCRPAEDDPQALVLTWTEDTGSPPAEGRGKRFGSVALERVVPTSLEGEARLTIEGSRLEYRLTIPQASFDLHGEDLEE